MTFADYSACLFNIVPHANLHNESINTASISSGTQTTFLVSQKSTPTQTEFISNKGIQTETASTIIEQKNTEINAKEKNEQKLMKFLKKISPLMISEMEENTKTFQKIFDEFYSKQAQIACKNEENRINFQSKLYFHSNSTIDNFSDKCLFFEEREEKKKCATTANDILSGICSAWNPRKTQIAVGYGTRKHNAWCLHSSHIIVWNINQFLKTRLKMNVRTFNTANNAKFNQTKKNANIIKLNEEGKMIDIENKNSTIVNDKHDVKPEHMIEISSCCSSIAYHPEIENILCLGLFTGSISIWQLKNTSDIANNYSSLLSSKEICCSSIDDYFHRQPITDLQWVKNCNQQKIKNEEEIHLRWNWNLISVSLDGKILVWNLLHMSKLQFPYIGYQLLPTQIYHGHELPSIHRNLFGKYENESKECLITISIAKIAFPQQKYGSFIIGTEGGGVIHSLDTCLDIPLKCKRINGCIWTPFAYRLLKNISQPKQAKVQRIIEKYAKVHKIKKIEIAHIFQIRSSLLYQTLYPMANIKQAFKTHLGRITALQYSPFSRNLFLSCSVDGYLRIFSMFCAKKPVIEIMALSVTDCSSSVKGSHSQPYFIDAKWSNIRPTIIACIDSNSQLIIYDIAQYRKKQTCALKMNVEHQMNCLQFDGKNIVICDDSGYTVLYQLSGDIVQYNPQGMKFIQNLIQESIY